MYLQEALQKYCNMMSLEPDDPEASSAGGVSSAGTCASWTLLELLLLPMEIAGDAGAVFDKASWPSRERPYMA